MYFPIPSDLTSAGKHITMIIPFGIIIVICFPADVKSEIILGQCSVHESIRRMLLESIFGK